MQHLFTSVTHTLSLSLIHTHAHTAHPISHVSLCDADACVCIPALSWACPKSSSASPCERRARGGEGWGGRLESRRGSASRKHQFNATVTSTLHERSTSIQKIVFFGYLAAENFSTILAEKSTNFSPEVGQKWARNGRKWSQSLFLK